MKSMTLVILLVTIITVPYSKETLKDLIEHFMALNQHDNMGIQKMISEQRE